MIILLLLFIIAILLLGATAIKRAAGSIIGYLALAVGIYGLMYVIKQITPAMWIAITIVAIVSWVGWWALQIYSEKQLREQLAQIKRDHQARIAEIEASKPRFHNNGPNKMARKAMRKAQAQGYLNRTHQFAVPEADSHSTPD